jgi:3-oxoacyl-[acyl-carrier protein] reductase
MSDILLQLGQNPNARKIIKSLGLPIPMPQPLRRAKGPMEERPLQDHTLVFGAIALGPLAQVVADTVTAAGANPRVAGAEALMTPFRAPGEAFGRPATRLDVDALPERFAADALVFDATAAADVAALRGLYDFFHPLVASLAKCGRAVVLGRSPAAATDAAVAATSAALEGFVRSLAKEVGKRGATAQLVYVDAGAEERLPGLLRFLLSPRSAYLTGQPLHLSAAVRAVARAPWVHSLAGKVALVTGAARGIGEATARLLAGEGAHVVCLDLPADDGPASKLAREIGGSVLLVDVANPEAPARIAADLKARGGVDVVVHNAGITRDKTLARMKPEQWDLTLDVNLAAIVRINAALVKDGALKDDARIICLSSVAGIAGNMGQTNYAASKSGLIGYVRKLAGELAPRGITVNAVAPGFIETRLTDAIPVMIREVGRRLSNLGQGGQPQDVGEVINFLATPQSSGLTGNVVRVCGGALIGA